MLKVVVSCGFGKPLESAALPREQAVAVRGRMIAKGYLAMLVPVPAGKVAA